MFVSKAKYNELMIEFNDATQKYNQLVSFINSKGGQAFLDNGIHFNDTDIKRLISLCHPDKHNNRNAAKEMTQRLLELKGNQS